MKYFRKPSRKIALVLSCVACAAVALVYVASANGEMPSWLRYVEARSALESVFFRAMPLPEGDVLYRRPPRETRDALGDLLKAQPKDAALYSLRALEDEQSLDFVAAENDWKLFLANSTDPSSRFALADFYRRRLRPLDELAALSAIATAPPDASEEHFASTAQQSWKAFDRIFEIIQVQGLPVEQRGAQYRSWIARYPHERSVYQRFLDSLAEQKDFAAANRLIAEYQKQFPDDQIFPVKATAQLEYQQGSLQRGIAVYEKTFQPLWAPELISDYFALLSQTHSLRKFLGEANAAVKAHPEDMAAAARVFYYYQQQGRLDAAQQAITSFRLRKEAAKSEWSAQDLYICARLLEDIHSYPESARFYFALYNARNNAKDGADARERALAGLSRLLLTAPETPIRLGSGELSIYRDIASMDQGPGYLNGILSLILNTTSPEGEFTQEEPRATPYFHRSRAAELLALLDAQFPNSPDRPELHTKLIEFYSSAGESEAVIKSGTEFLNNFPQVTQRTTVALLMADAYARTDRSAEEFAIYDSVLRELAKNANGVPLSGGDASNQQLNDRSPEYSRVLERYLARLVELKQILPALGVLRREIDQYPNDPGLYERLATFLEQNRLGAEQEDVYRRAMARFPDRSWYHKLARYYLRRKQVDEFESLSREAIKIFNGSDLENYFQSVVGGGPDLYLRLNLYANQRFPHNPVFVHNLLSAYTNPYTRDPIAWEALLRQHWFEDPALRNIFFEYLSASRKLDAELKSLQKSSPAANNWQDFAAKNPAAADYIAQAELWGSHFEQSAPVLKALAEEYPAAADLGNTASSVFRSLAYFDPANTAVAVKIAENLLAVDPADTQNIARIGDIYADRELFAQAASYWERIPQVAPSDSSGYLDAATIYWDYFDFDNAIRLLNQGRKKLANDNLYAYEAGAIYEGKRQYQRAIQEYAKGALAEGLTSQSAYRLLDLAHRPKYRELVDRETQQLTSGGELASNAIALRVSTLEILDRKKDLAPFLEAAVARATTVERAAEIGAIAQQRSLEAVREHALEKEVSLSTDPVARLQARYTLAGLYESRKDFASAQRNIEALYRENPKILGVVRSTVDFYWRIKAYPQAIAVLQASAKSAYPDLARQFTFEAARKSTDAKLYPQARDLLAQLLNHAPFDSQYLAAMAETYAQSGNPKGLKQFYLDKIALFRSAPLSVDEKKAQIATLRRGLIPALTQLQDHTGAVDQYIELLNAFPEDEALTTESALYALRHQRQKQLADFYAKTVQQSPRDYRWSMVLARLYTNFEDFPAAIDAYAKSIAIRPDRVDLRVARAGLNERLMHFDDAAADYDRLYQLAYKDPKWMEKVAEVRARQGQITAAVAALHTTLIDGRPERAENYFEVARRLESWAMLPQARTFAEQGVATAGADLLAASENHQGANLYVRIMTRLREPEKAYDTLQTALSAASSPLPVLQQQIARQGIAAVTDTEYRRRAHESRVENARTAMRSALAEMGGTVSRYFTPEEKVTFSQFAERLHASMNLPDTSAFAIPLAETAGLADLEAAWRYDVALFYSGNRDNFAPIQPYVALQRRRLKFAELAAHLESFAARNVGMQHVYSLLSAADAYHSDGDVENDFRVLSEVPIEYMSGETRIRYLQFLLARRPQQLVQLASDWTPLSQEIANFAVANGDPALVHAVVAARGANHPPVWSNAYNSLAGLYFAESSPAVNKSFATALGDQTIGERLGKQLDRANFLAGDIWYYYGSRYGEYLAVTRQPSSGDFLVADLEHSPASSEKYLKLADYYAESGNFPAAIDDYHHVLELSPGNVSVYDRLALAYFRQGARKQAVATWRTALGILLKQIDSSHVPETLWSDFSHICDHLASRHLFSELKPDIDAVLRAYLRHNGNYRSNSPLRSAYTALHNPSAATLWLLDVSAAAPDPERVLSDISNASWIPIANRGPIFQRILQYRQAAVEKAALAKSEGYEKDSAIAALRDWQYRWANYLVDTNQFAQAAEYLAALPPETRAALSASVVPLELQIAAKLGTLDAKLTAYRADPQSAPASGALRSAATNLLATGDQRSARKLLDFDFAREIEEHRLVPANFLGLAEIRLVSGDTSGALELLRRLVLVLGNPFENLDPAASLLEKTGHNAEAVEFLEQLVKSTPWEPAFQLRLAKAKLVAARDVSSSQAALVSLASAQNISYALRIQAVSALSSANLATNLPSAELNLLAATHKPSAAAANQTFFLPARLRAAQSTPDPRVKIDLLRAALADTPARSDSRLPLFYAAAAQHADLLAIAAIDPLLQQLLNVAPPQSPYLQNQSVVSAAQSDPDADADQDNAPEAEDDSADEQIVPRDPNNDEYSDAAVQPVPALSPAKRAQLAAAVAEVLIRLNQLDRALPYLSKASTLGTSAPRRRQIAATLANVKLRVQHRRANMARQPILHQELEQDRVVRPRLSARSASLPLSLAPVTPNPATPNPATPDNEEQP